MSATGEWCAYCGLRITDDMLRVAEPDGAVRHEGCCALWLRERLASMKRAAARPPESRDEGRDLLETLRGVLEPFVKAVDEVEHLPSGQTIEWTDNEPFAFTTDLTVGDLRRARDAFRTVERALEAGKRGGE